MRKKRKKIVGPIDWRAPGSDEIIKVYKRTNKNKNDWERKTSKKTKTYSERTFTRYVWRRNGWGFCRNESAQIYRAKRGELYDMTKLIPNKN